MRLDRLDLGRCETDYRLEPDQVERIIRLVASHIRTEVHGESPIVSAELPPHGSGAGERFEGLLPPVSTGPCFAIRKPAARVYSLVDYVNDGIMSAEEARALSLAVVERRNILVAGGAADADDPTRLARPRCDPQGSGPEALEGVSMAAIKLERLPDRTPVKITITVAPELARALSDYAAAYEAAYGQGEPVAELIPAMLAAFLDSDRAFARARKSKGTAS